MFMLTLDTHVIKSVKDQFFFGDMLKPLQNTTMRIAIELLLMVEIRQTRADTCIYDYIYIHSFWNAPPRAGSQLDGLNETSIFQVLALHLTQDASGK